MRKRCGAKVGKGLERGQTYAGPLSALGTMEEHPRAEQARPMQLHV
jgi:hypothetical protein